MKIFSLQMLRLEFSLEAVEPISLPRYKGSAFHGGFGHALQKISPTWFQYFFQPVTQLGNQIPKPFVLLPPLDEQQDYQTGDAFACHLTLFGDAIEHYAIAQAAIEYLGREMGLGYSRGRFKINQINLSRFTHTPIDCNKLTLSFNSRLRLKSSNQLQKQTPAFSLVIARLSGRLKTLQQAYNNTQIEESCYRQILQQARQVHIIQSNVHWDDWDRYSGSQKEWMKFGGLLGEVTYQGELQAFIPLLQMGEWCHLGGKSSFGLGKYSIIYEDN